MYSFLNYAAQAQFKCYCKCVFGTKYGLKLERGT